MVNPPHRLTVNLVGVGGNGIRMLTQLARIDFLLQHLGHPGLYVSAYDPKKVSEACLGRQTFSSGDIGQNKATIAINRLNRQFGLGWNSHEEPWEGQPANIIITAVDNSLARIEASRWQEIRYGEQNNQHIRPYYWMDLGNGDYHGQFVIGTIGGDRSLKCVPDIFPEILFPHTDEASCSVMESITKQSPFINYILTDMAAMLLFDMITKLETDYQGMIINIKDNIYNKIMI